jgi:hypothetical protein
VEKVLRTLLFLATVAAASFVEARRQRWGLEEVRGRRRGALVWSLLGIAILLLAFLQFWLLTGVLPLKLILLLVGASVVAATLYAFIGAVAGFGLQEKQHKINALTVIWLTQSPRMNIASMVTALVVWTVSVIGSLWVYWSHPAGDPGARVLVALFLFTIPQLIGLPLIAVVLWPVVTSEFLDDDLRNARLASQFALILSSTIYLLFPVWLFQEEIGTAIHPLPSIWLLLSVPLMMFLVGNVLPFFVGVYRFRSRARVLLEWRWRWMIDVLKLVKLPKGELRSQGVDEQIRDLEAEIRRRLAENTLFQFYENLLTLSPDQATSMPDAPVASSQSKQLVRADTGSPMRTYVKVARDYFRRSGAVSVSETMGQEEPVLAIVRENRKELVDWDIRFAHIYHLIELYRVALEGKAKNVIGYLEASLLEVDRDIANLLNRKNVLPGSLLAAFSAVIVWALNAYQSSIVNLIRKLVPT